MPSTPYHASVVITVRALEAFVRGLCDLHVVAPRPYLGAQFSTAFDVYLSLRAAADQRMKAALGRDVPNWRLKNACPACLYELEGEPKLKRRVIVTQDGNNSLKRFGRRERVVRFDGTVVPGDSKERHDRRQAPGDFFLPRSDVEEWAKDEVDELMKDFAPEAGEGGDEGAGCEERWENMKEDVTACAWGLYDETGIFPALCRHGFVLVVVDMVKSGELAKYGLSVINHLLRVLGEVTVGIDVGCKVARQVKAHPQLSVLAKENNFKAVVGAFHGLGHGRLCSICNMAMYVDGMGLEDCENCESYFSKSNALGATTRYSTVFHRQQAISTYMRHTDLCDAYQGLTTVIGNKYRRALKIKQGLPALQDAMRALNVSTRDVFETWLAKEKEYLQSMKKEPVEETNEMEYYQKLVNLYASEERLRDIRRVNAFVPAVTDATYAEAAKQTRRLETQRRHTGEVVTKSLAAVQDLELRLGIATRWVAGGEEWDRAALLVKNRSYQRALDHLQGLIVARMFELAKMNMSGTAWKQVVEYAFLAEFDLLREGRDDIRNEPWALPAGRVAMDRHFKMLRADEEIERLNLEIPRLLTYMADEKEFLVYHEERLRKEGNAALAHQVRAHRLEYGRFDDLHRRRLYKLAKEPGFTASLSRGRPEVDVEMPDAAGVRTRAPENDEEEGEEEEGDDMDAIAEAFENIVHIAHDAEAAEGGG
ncbi:hypothetical protein B0H14DRAFT_3101793 [Mycena olivaceomarginata]|nr:hypothetical protein B0H14DRAFT_3101793 [Mycena olivaceomarginata]